MREHRIRKTKTVCTYCGVGCSFDVWTKDRHILKIAPEHGPANGISTCVKGKFGWGHINSEDRLTTPLIREGNEFRSATCDEALSLIARRFSELKAANGPDCMAFISSSKCTNEESYLSKSWREPSSVRTMSIIVLVTARRQRLQDCSEPSAMVAILDLSPISRRRI